MSGQSRDLLTPLGKREGRQTIASQLVELSTGEVDSRVADMEESEAKKVGSLSIMLEWARRRGTLKPYWIKTDYGPDDQVLSEAYARVRAYVPTSLRPLTIEASAERLPRNTALGLPLVTSDSNAIPEYTERARKVTSPSDFYPSICYWRGQAQGMQMVPQQRIVWGFDHAETIVSGKYLHPAVEALKKLPTFAEWGEEGLVDTTVYNWLLPYARETPGSRFLSVDYSGFDTSVRRELIHLAFNMLREWYPGNEDDLNLVEEVFATSGIVTPDGWHYGRDGSVPSGSALTNLVDSLVNAMVCEYSGIKRGKEIRYLVQGDDALVAGTLTAEELSEDAKEMGMTVGVEKSRESDQDADFLRRLFLFDEGYEHGIASITRRASSLSGYERFKKGWNLYLESSRNISLMEVCRYHPNLRNMVKYMFDRDEVLARYDPTDIVRLAGGPVSVNQMLGLDSWKGSGRDLKGLENFASVRLLREYRMSRTNRAVV